MLCGKTYGLSHNYYGRSEGHSKPSPTKVQEILTRPDLKKKKFHLLLTLYYLVSSSGKSNILYS